MERRQVLAATTGAGLAGLAGCSAFDDECPARTDAETPPDGWPVPGYDAANAAVGPGAVASADDIAEGDRPLEADSIERWRFEVWEEVDTEGIASEPIVDAARLYLAFGRPSPGAETGGTLLAIDESTGELDWEYAFSPDASGAPALVGDGVLVGDADGTLRRLERDTGALDWETDLDGAVRTPVVTDGWCYVQCRDGRVHAVDVETGDRCWTARAGDLRERVGFGDDFEAEGRPAVTDDAVVVTTGIEDERTTLLRVLERESGEERWKLEVDDGNEAPRSPVVSDDIVFVAVSGGLFAYDMEGNREWSFATGFDRTSAPAVDESTGSVYLAAKNVYALDRETGEERWRHVNLGPDGYEMEGGRVALTATPAVVDDVVAVGFGALGRDDGDHLWGDVGNDAETDYFSGGVRGSPVPNDGPAIANGALYATTTFGRVAKVEP